MKRRRYQECSWLMRRWRDRWLLLIPYWVARDIVRGERIGYAWTVSRGWCDYKRDWVWTTAEELEAQLERD